MSAVLALGRVAPGSIAPRDWLASLAVHAGVLIAAMPLVASLGDMPVKPAPLQVPIRWVEAPPGPAPAPTAKPEPEPEPKPAPKPKPKPAPKPAPKPKPEPRPKPASKPTPAAKPASASTRTREEPRLDPRPDPRIEVPREAAVAARRDPAPVAAPPAPEAARSVSAQPLTDNAPSVHPTATATDAARSSVPATAASPDPSAPDLWRADLEALLATHKRYPRQARRMGQQGVVTVHARFAADGELLRCEVAASSGFRALDEAALELVRLAAEQLRVNQAPGRLAEVHVPISYELNGRGT